MLHKHIVQDAQVFLIVMTVLWNIKLSILLDIQFASMEVVTWCRRQRSNINWAFNRTEPAVFTFPHYQQCFCTFCIPRAVTNLEKMEMQKLSQAFVCICQCPNSKKHWCLYKINQHYPENIHLKLQWQRKELGYYWRQEKLT